MKIAPVADVKARLSAYLEQAAATGPVVITKNGKAVAVLIAPTDDDDLERLVLSRSPKFLSVLARSHDDIARGRTVSAKEFFAARQPSRKQAKR